MPFWEHLFLLVALLVAMPVIKADFFPDTNKNLTKITWAHAVNNQTYLDGTLKNEKINMIEADIVLGKLHENDTEKIPIMAHPPATTSDLSLESFLEQIDSFNQKANSTSRKGVKLDFKTEDAFNQSLTYVKKYEKASFPVWINADILPGPINATTDPVDATFFLSNAKAFPNSTLSIGWTTSYDPNVTGSYQETQIDAMIKAIKDNEITQEITFPVRAGLAAQSRRLMVNLTEEIERSTLTIWSAEDDNVDVEDLRKLIKEIGLNRTYVDVPVDLLEKLRLNDLPSNGGVARVASGACALSVVLAIWSLFQNI